MSAITREEIEGIVMDDFADADADGSLLSYRGLIERYKTAALLSSWRVAALVEERLTCPVCRECGLPECDFDCRRPRPKITRAQYEAEREG